MGLPKFRYAVLLGLITGMVVPVVFMLCFRWRLFPAGDWLLFIWPTSLMLMATANLGYSPEAFGIVALSIFYNAVLYIVVFSLIWCIGWAMGAWRASLRDGTTI